MSSRRASTLRSRRSSVSSSVPPRVQMSSMVSNKSNVVAPSAPRPFLEEPDASIAWLFQPHTILGLLAVVFFVVYNGFLRSPPSSLLNPADTLNEYRARGLASVCVVFLLYCALQLRDSLLLRPHPAFWRVVHGIGLLYLMGLVFLLVFPADDSRRLLRIFAEGSSTTTADSIIEPPLNNKKAYAEDCRLYTPNDPSGITYFARVWEAIDIFVIAHTVGWWGKAVLLRDWRLAWSLSILWELLEYSLQGILPNFQECWWDHWVLDFVLSNGLGLWLGMLTVEWLNMRQFDWSGLQKSEEPLPSNPFQQALRLLQQFTPYSFSQYEWKLYSSLQNFLAVCLLILIMEVIEVNAFFLKYVLYLPPEYPLNSWRLGFWFFMALPATSEYYDYLASSPKTATTSSSSSFLTDKEEGNSSGGGGDVDNDGSKEDDDTPPHHNSTNKKRAKRRRIGPNLWLALALAAAEVLVCVKYAQQSEFHQWTLPPVVLYSWGVAIIAYLLWVYLFVWRDKNKSKQTQVSPANWRPLVMNALVMVSVGSLSYLAYSMDVGLGSKGRQVV